ncbi:LysR family transcriptional regulator [Desemzia sp. C1]|uniref:LysR family transcriptional regulator n=1 Tax=Desemzia TaxID=82800 RepID=UPI0016616BCD|nr:MULTISPECIES: LysR family transcriptional regulator [Desemzia]MCI3028388.1 LysR family transcriptional regulator [Desemzia sp. C1]
MNLLKLQYFVDLVEIGNFSKVAEKNFVSQTNISQQIQSLEEYFECKLIDRSSKPVRPTKVGEVLYEEAVKILAQFIELKKRIVDSRDEQTRIKIGYTSILDINLLARMVNSMKQNSNYLFDMQHLQLKDVSDKLLNQKLDLAISFDSEFQDHSSIETITLYEGDYVAVVGKGHPLFNRKEITMSELYDYPLVMLSPQSIGKSYYMMISKAQHYGFIPNIEKLVDDVETELFILQTQSLLGFFPENYPIPIDRGEMKMLSIKDNHHKYKIVVAYNKNNINPQISAVLRYVKSLV